MHPPFWTALCGTALSHQAHVPPASAVPVWWDGCREEEGHHNRLFFSASVQRHISAVYLLLQSGESSQCLKGLSCFSWHYGQNIIKTSVAGTELSVRERTWLKAFLQPRDFNFSPLLLPYPGERNITKNQDRDFSAKFISSSICCNGDMFGFAACLLFAEFFMSYSHQILRKATESRKGWRREMDALGSRLKTWGWNSARSRFVSVKNRSDITVVVIQWTPQISATFI